MREALTTNSLTIPNALTASRLVVSPVLAKRLYKNPRKWVLPTAAVMLSDNLDGFLARLGKRSPKLARLGFRESELGRVGDPVVDKVLTTEMLVAGMANRIIPTWLGALSLAQKTIVSLQTLQASRQGAEIHVTEHGKEGEFLTNVGIGALFLSELSQDEHTRETIKGLGIGVALVGIASAFMASREYHQQAHIQRPEQTQQ
jgi:phosphatidylglycerophosphate synthase